MNFPDDTRTRVHGIFQRQRMFIDAFGGMGDLDFLFFVEPRIDVSPPSVERYREILSTHYGREIGLSLVTRMIPARQSRWEAYGAGVFNAYRQYGFRWASGRDQAAALDAALDRHPDVLFVHRLGPMGAVERTGRRLPPMFFDLDDIEHRAFARGIPHPPSWPGKKLYYLQVPALWKAEQRAIRRSARTFVCSEEDRSYLERTMRVDGVRVIPNAVAIPDPCPPAPDRTVMFIGVLSYAPNRNAAGLLVNHIWPTVRQLVPDAELLIAGSYADQVEGFPGGDGVTFTGFVEDLDELYARTKVVCVPIATGGGTRIKIIEAAGYGRPVVSTPIGAEGLDMIDGEHILLREEPDAIAHALAGLLLDDERGRELGLAGREAVRQTYDRNSVIVSIREEVRSALPAAPTRDLS